MTHSIEILKQARLEQLEQMHAHIIEGKSLELSPNLDPYLDMIADIDNALDILNTMAFSAKQAYALQA